tara:strand:+ start:168 stop:710 length:543 start_codon:yes stop_codon:yes gene_type:complete
LNNNEQKLINHIESEPLLKEAFLILKNLNSDLWISAGFIRNNIWNLMTDKQIDLSCDVDVIYFDPTNLSEEIELKIKEKLLQINKLYNWSVKNQARMASKNNTNYNNLSDALSKFPETATSVAMRYKGSKLEVLSPHGLDDLYNFTIRPTPMFKDNLNVIKTRMEKKRWQEKWPDIKFIK